MIYLDYNATTPVDKKVLETFNKVCINYPGNSNSLHKLGIKSKELEDYATEKIAQMLNIKPQDIIYTSGASESNNTAIKGICSKYKNRGKHIITTMLEHSSVSSTIKYLTNNGFEVDYIKIKDKNYEIIGRIGTYHIICNISNSDIKIGNKVIINVNPKFVDSACFLPA